MKYVLAVSIGPVQDFIASARRSRDLWFGSWLLSELSKEAAREIATREGDGACLVFPSLSEEGGLIDLNPNSQFNVANKIVAIIKQDVWSNGGELELKGVRDAVKRRLEDIRRDAFSQLRIPGPYFHSAAAVAQVSDLIEFMWAVAPLGNDPDAYRQAREAAERLLAARKTTRDFRPTREWARAVPKSSFDGARESVIDEKVYDLVKREQLTEFELRRDYGVRPGERLCGVALLKRHGRKEGENRVFSTSHVAAGPLLACLREVHRAAVEDLEAGLVAAGASLEEHSRVPEAHPIFGRLDGHILYAERLKEIVPDDKLPLARQALGSFFKATGLPRPGTYYALLLADGDWMGATIDAQETPEGHRALSHHLAAFAAEAPHIIRRAGGSPIYVGGDDMLAFLPLHTALSCARELARLFADKLSGFHFIDEEGRRASPTLSAGLCVAHHLSPLSDVLELARRAEKEAKAVKGKRALAVIVDKRSGVAREVAGKWGELDERLKKFAGWHLTGKVPDGAAYQLRDLALRLAGTLPQRDEDRDTLDLAARYEAVRVFGRKRVGRSPHEMEQDVLSYLNKLVLSEDLKPGPLSVSALADELIVAREFAAAAAIAGESGEV